MKLFSLVQMYNERKFQKELEEAGVGTCPSTKDDQECNPSNTQQLILQDDYEINKSVLYNAVSQDLN